jgi:hypothetical protein
MIGGNGEVRRRGKGEEPRDRKDRENLFFHSYVSPFLPFPLDSDRIACVESRNPLEKTYAKARNRRSLGI